MAANFFSYGHWKPLLEASASQLTKWQVNSDGSLLAFSAQYDATLQQLGLPELPDEVCGDLVRLPADGTANGAEVLRVSEPEEFAPALKEQLRAHVGKEIGSLAKPDDVRFAAGLPKTRSGKIMRRLLKELATSGVIKGDTTTLEDFSVITALKADEE